MQDQATASGHVFCVKRKRGPQWYCKYRIGGKQIQKRLGPAWTVGGPRPTVTSRARRPRRNLLRS
jgi:hypothetical protein